MLEEFRFAVDNKSDPCCLRYLAGSFRQLICRLGQPQHSPSEILRAEFWIAGQIPADQIKQLFQANAISFHRFSFFSVPTPLDEVRYGDSRCATTAFAAQNVSPARCLRERH